MSNARIQKLVGALDELADLLERDDRAFWAGELRSRRDELLRPETVDSARAEINAAFGGMGSLNDIVFEDEEADAQFG